MASAGAGAGAPLAIDEPGPAEAKGFRAWAKANAFALVLLAPTILVLFALTIFPLIYSVYISLFEYYLPRPTQRSFIGFDNYGAVLTDARFWASMRITGVFMLVSISLQFILGTALAVFFFDEFRGRSAKAVYLPLILVPMMIAPVVVGYVWRLLYQVEFGPLNFMLLELGLPRLEFTASAGTALLAIVVADIWQWTPFVTLVMLAGLVSLPQELFEVAEMDGASTWQRLRHVMLPLLSRVIAIILLIRLLDSFRELDKIFIMTQGGPGTSTETVSYYAFLAGFKFFRIGYAAAMSLLLLLVTVIICTGIAKVLHKEQAFER